MKVLCKDGHYREFNSYPIFCVTGGFLNTYCNHCDRQVLKRNKKKLTKKEKNKLENHTCKARLKELRG